MRLVAIRITIHEKLREECANSDHLHLFARARLIAWCFETPFISRKIDTIKKAPVVLCKMGCFYFMQ
jgi:hypothetical protein